MKINWKNIEIKELAGLVSQRLRNNNIEVLLTKTHKNKINFDLIKKWSKKEGETEKFKKFLRLAKD